MKINSAIGIYTYKADYTESIKAMVADGKFANFEEIEDYIRERIIKAVLNDYDIAENIFTEVS